MNNNKHGFTPQLFSLVLSLSQPAPSILRTKFDISEEMYGTTHLGLYHLRMQGEQDLIHPQMLPQKSSTSEGKMLNTTSFSIEVWGGGFDGNKYFGTVMPVPPTPLQSPEVVPPFQGTSL